MTTNTQLRQVVCGDRTIEYLLTRKKVKNINLRIKPEGKVYVSASQRVSAAYIDDFIREKQAYILDALDRYEEQRKEKPAPKEYVSGEKIKFLGEILTLRVIKGQPESMVKDGAFVILTVKDEEDFQRKEKLVSRWLREKSLEIFQQISREVYEKFKRYGVKYPVIKVRTMTSRWGSCQTQKGIITLNTKLIEAPRSCVEYVILHEFAHFIYPNHSRQFHDFVTTLMPDWKERKRVLEEFNSIK